MASVGVPMRHADRDALMPGIAELFASTGTSAKVVQRIVCGAGPGSFTSLRVAASIAKGLALGLECPLYVVPSLALVAAAGGLRAGRYLVALDALRGEHHAALYERSADGRVTEISAAELVRTEGLQARAERHSAWLVGPGQSIDRAPHAADVPACEALISAAGPVDLVSWEPDYGRKAEAQVKWEAAHGRPLARG
jgi:tRNA threonylcarbamoyladenosine biosynthesis protein TsaB